MRRPLLSVVIPCRNAEDFIESAVRSVLNQSLRDLEVIVVDDGSTDSSARILASLAQRDRRVRVLQSAASSAVSPSEISLSGASASSLPSVASASLGPGVARNLGVSHARGRYLAFVDADDRVLPGAYQDMVSTLESTHSDFVIGGYRRHGSAGSQRPRLVARVHTTNRRALDVAEFPAILDEPVLWNRVFSTHFWRTSVGAIPEDVNYEDQEPTLRAALHARAFDVLARDVYSWRLPESRDSRSQSKSRIEDLRDRLTIIRRMWAEVAPSAPLPVRRRLIANWLGRDLVMYALNVPSVGADYTRVLREGARALAEKADEQTWTMIPVQDRLVAWTLARSSQEDLEEVLGSRLEDTTAVPIELVPAGQPAPTNAATPRGELIAAVPVLDRIAPVPDFIRAISPDDLRVECSTHRISWTDAATCTISADAHIPGVDPQALDGSPIVEVVAADGTSRPAHAVTLEDSALTDYWANDPWRTYLHSGFRASLDLLDVASQRVRVTLSIAGHTVSAMLPEAATAHSFRVGPLGDPRFVCRADANGCTEFVRCARSPYRLVGARGGATAISFDIAAEAADAVALTDVLPVTLVRGSERLPAEVALRDGHLQASVDLEPLGSERQYTGERVWRIVVGDPGVHHGNGTRPDEVPVMWDKSAHPERAWAVRACPSSDGFAAIEQRARRVTVDGAFLEGNCLVATGRVSPQGWTPRVCLVSSTATVVGSAEETIGGQWQTSFDLADADLVPGGYFLRWSLPEGRDAPGWCRAGHAMRSEEAYLFGSVRSVRVSPKHGGLLGLTIGAPLAPAERSRFGRQRLIEATPPPLRDGILFESFNGMSSADNPGAICADLQTHGVDVPLWWSVVDGTVSVPPGTTPLVIGTRAWFEIVRSARVLVTNNNFPQWFQKQPGQAILQTWHGTPIKRLLFDAPTRFIPLTYRRLMRRQVGQWNLLLAQTEQAARDLCSSTRYTGEVRVGEQPRNVGLLGGEARAREVRSHLGIDKDERVVLYAPTWREGMRASEGESALATLLDPAELARRTRARVLVRSHHMNGLHAHGEGVLDVGAYPSVEDLMLIADVLVSDYSSIFFDYALTGRPGLIFAPDLEWYRDVERGFYGKWPGEWPWPLTRDQDSLGREVQEILARERTPPDVDADPIRENLEWIRRWIAIHKPSEASQVNKTREGAFHEMDGSVSQAGAVRP